MTNVQILRLMGLKPTRDNPANDDKWYMSIGKNETESMDITFNDNTPINVILSDMLNNAYYFGLHHAYSDTISEVIFDNFIQKVRYPTVFGENVVDYHNKFNKIN